MISHSKPTIDNSDIKVIAAAMKTGNLVQGAKVDQFEKRLAKYIGSKSAVVVNSGTSALHLALLALGVGKGDEVIIPSYVCTAVLNAVNYTGARARLVDVKEEDFNISVDDVKKKIT